MKTVPGIECPFSPDEKSLTEAFWRGVAAVEASRHFDLRDYFIAHAPAEPQWWFRPVMRTPRPKTRFVGENGTEYIDRMTAEKACGEDGWNNPNHEAQGEWDVELKKQLYIQWPAAWADEMMKARGAT